ncbi:MAG: ABC transporter permease [Caldilineae bacterium]|nr:MAG: ABC transporter permease [Caldilineae bacterium]
MRIVLEPRLTRSRALEWGTPLISVALALVFSGALLAIFGANPWETYVAMAKGAFGERYAISETLVKAIPLLLTGLAVSIAFRMLFWNIGAEGQLAWGAVAATWVALFLPERLDGLPGWAFLPLMFLAAFAAGALWGVIPGLLKAYLNVNEIITTLMLNYVALLWMQYLYTGPWKDPQGFGFPGTAQFPQEAWLPRMPLNLGRVHYGLALGLVAAVLLWFVLSRTKWGLEIKVIGENPQAARYAGMDIARNMVLVMIISGGLAGLAGFSQVAGVAHRLQNGIAVGDGFTAIIVAWLAKLNPWGVVLVSFLMAGLSTGGDQLQITMGLPAAVAGVLQGSILFFVLGGDVFTKYRLRILRTGPAAASALAVSPAPEKVPESADS